MLKPAFIRSVQPDMIPTGARFIVVVVLLVATAGLAVLACGDWIHGHHAMGAIDAVLCLTAGFGFVRVARPIAGTRLLAEEDPFDGSRGILWSVVLVVLIALLVVVVMMLTSPDAVRGFMDGWRAAG